MELGWAYLTDHVKNIPTKLEYPSADVATMGDMDGGGRDVEDLENGL